MRDMINRGDIYWVDWEPARGSEQRGKRPALVIQNDLGNRYSRTTIVAALTTASEKTYPFTVPVTGRESGLPKDSTVNLSAIITIDKIRLEEKCGQLDLTKMTEVDKAIKASLGLK